MSGGQIGEHQNGARLRALFQTSVSVGDGACALAKRQKATVGCVCIVYLRQVGIRQILGSESVVVRVGYYRSNFVLECVVSDHEDREGFIPGDRDEEFFRIIAKDPSSS